MSMNLGGEKRGGQSEMNVTPMIDVLLVLIIIFMLVTQSVKSRGLDTLIPQPATQTDSAPPPERTVVLQLTGSRGDRPRLLINTQPVTWDQLRTRLFQIYTTRAERILFIKADPDLDFESIADAIDIARSDFPDLKVGLITERIETGV